MKNSNYKNGFTLIELIVVIAITAVLSGMIFFAVTQYINSGKDSNIAGNLVSLIPAGEAYYNANGSSYNGFCNMGEDGNHFLKNVISQMPENENGSCDHNLAGVCCNVDPDDELSWAACAQKFANPDRAFCVDSRGNRKEISTRCCGSNDIFRCDTCVEN